MEVMYMWKIVHNVRERPAWDTEWSEWHEYNPEYYKRHETALFYIQKQVANACDKKEGKVLKRDQCSDGWEYYEWEENDDGIIKQHVMQIAGGRLDYVVMD